MPRVDEGPLTQLRREHKVALALDEGLAFCRTLEERFGLPSPGETQVTSVYFDRADGALARAARERSRRGLKVRTKEYAPDLSSPLQPRCVVELKRHLGLLTRKRRVWLPRAALRALFLGGAPSDSAAATAEAVEALRAVGGAGALAPLVAVTYRRRVYPLARGLRVTFDWQLCFYRAPTELLLGPEALGPARLPPPFAREPRAVLELKTLTARLPDWAAPLFPRGPGGYSKFATAVERLASAEADAAEAAARPEEATGAQGIG